MSDVVVSEVVGVRPTVTASPLATVARPRSTAAQVAAIRPPGQREGWSAGKWVLVGVMLFYIGLVLVVPLGALVVETARAGARLIAEQLIAQEAFVPLAQSLLLAAIAVVVNGIAGVAAAIVLVRHRFRGRAVLDAMVDLSIAVSPVMTGLAFLLLFGRGGWLYPALDAVGVQVVFAFPGLVLATLFVTLPFVVREASYVLEEIGTQEEEVAVTLGATPWQAFRRVTLPNVRHALSLGLTLTAARALGEFGAVLVVGGAISGKTQTATTFIYGATEERHDAAAFGMALILALASVILLVALEELKRRRTLGRDGE
jgi:sulfate transport system permease protein